MEGGISNYIYGMASLCMHGPVAKLTESMHMEHYYNPQEEEDIYQVPAVDVNGLYSQLSAIRTPILTRDSVRY